MGFLEYARALSFQKDDLKTRILLSQELQQPTFMSDETGYNITIPVPSVSDSGIISFFGFEFPADVSGKAHVGRLFRACVYHLSAHTLVPIYERKSRSSTVEHAALETFAESLVDDIYVNNYISTKHSDKLPDVAFVNALAFARIKSAERILNHATRMMAAVLMRANIGMVKGTLSSEEEAIVDRAVLTLDLLRKKIVSTQAVERTELGNILKETADDLIQILEPYGPVIEAPSLPYTEKIGPCKVFSKYVKPSEPDIQNIFWKSMEILSGKLQNGESFEACWKKQSDSEATQAFDTWLHQKAREEKILTKLRKCIELVRFKSICFPEEDYAHYLRARTLLSGGSRRLLDSLRVAQDAFDEDPGKEFGQLDLAAVINAIASKKPATDVFMRDEYLSRSFAWVLLFDASESMRIKGEFARALAICVAEATKELLMDPTSWALFAFSDRFYVLKDASEPYSSKVRARIGGLRFGGLTYLPDAIRAAGDILAKRYDEQRFLIVISDGWPYGYSDIDAAVSESIDLLQKKGIVVIGIGVETDKMRDFFKLSTPIHSQKDLIKRFAAIYLNSSAAALET